MPGEWKKAEAKPIENVWKRTGNLAEEVTVQCYGRNCIKKFKTRDEMRLLCASCGRKKNVIRNSDEPF